MEKHRIEQVVRAKGGTAKHIAQLDELSVPDCWNGAMKLKEVGLEDDAEAVLEAWHLCHDLLAHVRKLRDLTS